jgi:malate dehydrogenase (oxaloacetate-decarboxylating)
VVNNALAFPGIFRGALDARARRITEAMKIAAAEAIAAKAPAGELVPEILDRSVHLAVAQAVAGAASGSPGGA